MSNFIIEGGKKLHGTIQTSSGKNSAVALLSASLLIRGKVTLHNITHADDVERILEILESIGVKFQWKNTTTLFLDTAVPLRMEKINKKACRVGRSSLLLLGALAARTKSYKLYKSGGCKLGERTVRPHLYALQKLGVDVVSKTDYYRVTNKPLRGQKIVMYESGDTPTENAIMAAACAVGKTTISFASANYMVQEVCYFLKKAGAKIEGIGTTTLIITGAQKFHAVEYTISPDPVDAMTWISLAATTKSHLTITDCPMPFLELELEKLAVMGQKFNIKNERFAANGKIPLADVEIFPSSLKALPDKLYGRPYPGLNIDNVPLFVPILATAKGRTLVHDWCYENRAIYYVEMQKLGASVLLLDPHRVMIEGPTPLKANDIVCPPAIRPGVAILVAMIAAKGKSILRNAYPVERAYNNLVERLQKVGVHIKQE